jgi:TRAP-type C4-dicarboxylate transport system substrate-binding protein
MEEIMFSKASNYQLTTKCALALLSICLIAFAGNALADPTVLKLAHQWSAPHNGKGDDRSLMAQKFAQYVDRYSNGTLKVQVYPGNSLIPPRQQWDALTSGALDMAVIVPSYFSGRVSELRGLNMLGLVNSNAAAYKFINGPGGQVIKKLYEKHGVRPLVAFWGPESIGFRKQKVTTPSGLKGLKMRGPGPAIEKVYANNGASVVSMPSSDLYTALQTGALDGCITTFISMHSYDLYENLHYIAISPSRGGLLYAPSTLVMSNTVWKQLTKQQQKAIHKAAAKVQPWVEQQTQKEATRNAQFFKKHGVHVYQLTPKQFGAWMDAAKPVVKAYADTSPIAAKIVKYAHQANQSVTQ